MVLTNEPEVMIDIDSVNILDANETTSDSKSPDHESAISGKRTLFLIQHEMREFEDDAPDVI